MRTTSRRAPRRSRRSRRWATDVCRARSSGSSTASPSRPTVRHPTSMPSPAVCSRTGTAGSAPSPSVHSPHTSRWSSARSRRGPWTIRTPSCARRWPASCPEGARCPRRRRRSTSWSGCCSCAASRCSRCSRRRTSSASPRPRSSAPMRPVRPSCARATSVTSSSSSSRAAWRSFATSMPSAASCGATRRATTSASSRSCARAPVRPPSSRDPPGVRGLVLGGDAVKAILRERPEAAMAMLGTLADRISMST